MLVTSTAAFGTVSSHPGSTHSHRLYLPLTASVVQKASETVEFNASKVLSELGSITNHTERKNQLRGLEDTELIALNNTLFITVQSQNYITEGQKNLLLAISQVINERNIDQTPEESIRVNHQNGISRFDENKGRVETSNGWTQLVKIKV